MAEATAPGAAAGGTRYRPWEVGTGVKGYAWDAPRARAALLLQHGFGEYAERYVDQYGGLIPRLLEMGVSVYAFDLEGHGGSPGRRGLTDIERGVAHHLAARGKLREQPLPVFLLGHSLGGLVTATSVLRDPDGIRGVILSSPPLQVTAGPITRVLARVAAAVAPALPARRLPSGRVSRVPEHVRRFRGDPRLYHGSMPARLAASVLFTCRENWALYARWTVPTLVIHGTADRFTECEGSRRFVDAIASEDRTLHLIEGGYHELLNDVAGEETLRVVVAWLEERLPARRG